MDGTKDLDDGGRARIAELESKLRTSEDNKGFFKKSLEGVRFTRNKQIIELEKLRHFNETPEKENEKVLELNAKATNLQAELDTAKIEIEATKEKLRASELALENARDRIDILEEDLEIAKEENTLEVEEWTKFNSFSKKRLGELEEQRKRVMEIYELQDTQAAKKARKEALKMEDPKGF